MPKAKVARENN